MEGQGDRRSGDHRLIAALERNAEANVRLASALEALVVQFKKIPGEVDELRGRSIRYEIVLENVSKRLEHVELETEHTGSVYVGELKEKVRKYEGDKQHWVRYLIATLVTLAITGGSALIGWALKK